jgi:PleD family two-component response regulator
MAKGKNVLTTGDVAKICHVAPRTVSKWFDSGQLKGYRIPGSKDRRIPVSELIRFMKVHNIPTDTVPAGKIRVLVVDSDKNAASALSDILRNKGDYEVQTAWSNFETGTIAQKFAPHVLLVSLFAKDINATEICKSLRADEDLQTIKIIAIANQLSNSESSALLQKGFDDHICNPADGAEIIKKIEQATAIIY